MREDGITPAGSLSVVIDWQKAPELRSGEVYYAGCSFFSRYPFPSKIDKKGDAWVRIARFCSPPVSHGPTRVFELSRPLLLLFTSNRAAARRSPCQMDSQVYSPWLLQAIYRPVFFRSIPHLLSSCNPSFRFFERISDSWSGTMSQESAKGTSGF